MPGSMSRSDLLASLKESLMDAATALSNDGDARLIRLLDVAAADMWRVRPRKKTGMVVLSAGEAAYQAPDDMVLFVRLLWGLSRAVQPWDRSYPGPLPRVEELDGSLLLFSPAPSPAHLSAYGANCQFVYAARDAIGNDAAETTIAADHRGLLLLRAQAEAMNELALRDSVRPMQIRDGFSGQAKNGTPQYLWESLMKSWLLAAR